MVITQSWTTGGGEDKVLWHKADLNHRPVRSTVEHTNHHITVTALSWRIQYNPGPQQGGGIVGKTAPLRVGQSFRELQSNFQMTQRKLDDVIKLLTLTVCVKGSVLWQSKQDLQSAAGPLLTPTNTGISVLHFIKVNLHSITAGKETSRKNTGYTNYTRWSREVLV